MFYLCYPHLRTYSLILETGEGRERNIDVREKHRSVASYIHPNVGPLVGTSTRD